MPVLDWDPGTNPKAAGTLSFYKEGEDPASGFQVTTEGGMVVNSLELTGSGVNTAVLTVNTSTLDDRFILSAGGGMDWGPGDSATDTNLYRSAANTLRTDDTLSVGTGIVTARAAGTDEVFQARVTGDAQPQITIDANGRVEFGGGATAPDVALFRDGSTRLHTVNTFVTEGDVVCDVAGGGLVVREGSNAAMGTATLAAGTVVVSTTAVTANSRIFLTAQNTGGTPGALRVSARTAATSFTITSTSGTDTSSVAWMIVEPAA